MNITLTDGIADPDTECEKEDNTNGVESNTEEQISNDPSVIERSYDQDQLGHSVDYYTNQWEDEIGNE
jgi:hypothetical protein